MGWCHLNGFKSYPNSKHFSRELATSIEYTRFKDTKSKIRYWYPLDDNCSLHDSQDIKYQTMMNYLVNKIGKVIDETHINEMQQLLLKLYYGK